MHPVALASQENLGRPSIVAVSKRSRIVRNHRTRRTRRVVRKAPTTESRSLVHGFVITISVIIKVDITAFALVNLVCRYTFGRNGYIRRTRYEPSVER